MVAQMMPNPNRRWQIPLAMGDILSVATLVLFLLLSACQDAPQRAVEISSVEALQRLAKGYETVSASMDSNPKQLPPDERRRFVEFVFKEAGYSYELSLQALAEAELDAFDQQQKDLAELLFFPHRGLSSRQSLSAIYSRDELAQVLKIQTYFK